MNGGMKFAGGGESDIGMAGANTNTIPDSGGMGDGGRAVVSPEGAGIPNGPSVAGQVADKSYDSQNSAPRGGKEVDSPADTITF